MTKTYYTKEHEYIIVDGDTGTVGITDHAQGALGDIVFVEIPEGGKSVDQGDEAAVVESVKAASEVYAPVSGEVIEGNAAIEAEPAKVNSDAEGAAWFFKMKISDASQLESLMDADAYKKYLEEIS
ncbi:MAG: glycine cleavage system protein GcvH [Methyloligellaceae bacterium]